MSKLITREAFVEKLQRRGYKVVSTTTALIGQDIKPVEVYRRPKDTREYWVADQFCHRLVVNETSATWDEFVVEFQSEKGGEV